MNYFNQESERLIYRALTENDIDSWTEFFENNDRLIFLGIDLTRDNKTMATEWIMKQLDRYRNHQIMADDSLRDTVVFSIIESEWKTCKRALSHKIDQIHKKEHSPKTI